MKVGTSAGEQDDILGVHVFPATVHLRSAKTRPFPGFETVRDKDRLWLTPTNISTLSDPIGIELLLHSPGRLRACPQMFLQRLNQ